MYYLVGEFKQTADKGKVDLEAVKPEKWQRSRKWNRMLSFGAVLQSMQAKVLIPAYKLGDMWFCRENKIHNTILRRYNL